MTEHTDLTEECYRTAVFERGRNGQALIPADWDYPCRLTDCRMTSDSDDSASFSIVFPVQRSPGRTIEAGDDCAKVLHLIAASRGAINALMIEVLEGHVRDHVVDPAKERSAARATGAQQLIDVLSSYLM